MEKFLKIYDIRKISLALGFLVLLFLGYCTGISAINSLYGNWNEKITLIVSTPMGEISSHSVQRSSSSGGDLVTGRSFRSRKGEAVVLEIPTQNCFRETR